MKSASDHAIPAGTKVFVTGATGFVGSLLIRKLAELGLHVTALARPHSDRNALEALPIEWIIGDICDEGALAKGIAGARYIFHLASTYRNNKATLAEHHKVHVEGTKLLAQLASKEPSLKRFVHVSTIGVHGHVEHPPADETYPFNPGDDYQRTKAEGELWIRDFQKKAGLPLTVIRPATIYGPGDKRLFKIFKMVHKGWFPVIGNGNNLLHLTHVDDLTDFLIHAAAHPHALGDVFICAGEKALMLKEIISIIAAEYGVKPRLIRIPQAPVFALAYACETACWPFGINPPLFRRRVKFFTNDRSFNALKAKEVLNFIPKQNTEQEIRSVARWYTENGWLGKRRRASKFEYRMKGITKKQIAITK